MWLFSGVLFSATENIAPIMKGSWFSSCSLISFLIRLATSTIVSVKSAFFRLKFCLKVFMKEQEFAAFVICSSMISTSTFRSYASKSDIACYNGISKLLRKPISEIVVNVHFQLVSQFLLERKITSEGKMRLTMTRELTKLNAAIKKVPIVIPFFRQKWRSFLLPSGVPFPIVTFVCSGFRFSNLWWGTMFLNSFCFASTFS